MLDPVDISLGKNGLHIPAEYIGNTGTDRIPEGSPVTLGIPANPDQWLEQLPDSISDVLAVLQVRMDTSVTLLAAPLSHSHWPVISIAVPGGNATDGHLYFNRYDEQPRPFHRADSLYRFSPPDYIVDRDLLTAWCPGAGYFIVAR